MTNKTKELVEALHCIYINEVPTKREIALCNEAANRLMELERENQKLKAYAAAYRQVFISGKLYGSYPDEGEENEMYWFIEDKHVLEEPPENIQLLTEQERFDCFVDGVKFGAGHKNWLNGEDEFIEKAQQYAKESSK